MVRIAREIPELAGKLSAPRVTYVRSLRKTYITFESTVLAGEKQFLQMEKLLKELFPGRPLAVRIISPGLRASFLEDPMEYRQVLDDFLRRNYPAARGWVGQIDWQIEKNQLREDETIGEAEEAILTLIFPDEFSLQVMSEKNAGPRLARAIQEIFDARVRVEMTVAGDREERLRKIREEREQQAVITVTREEMEQRYGTGETGAAEPSAPKGDRKSAPRKPRTAKETERPEAQTVGKPIVGKSVAEKPAEIKSLTSESGVTVIEGEIFKLETKELKGGERVLVSFAVTDFTSSVLCKLFLRYRNRFIRKEEAEEIPVTDEERQAAWKELRELHEQKGDLERAERNTLLAKAAESYGVKGAEAKELVETVKAVYEATQSGWGGGPHHRGGGGRRGRR